MGRRRDAGHDEVLVRRGRAMSEALETSLEMEERRERIREARWKWLAGGMP